MKSILTKILLLFLAFTFVAMVFCYGTNKTYSPWVHMQKIVRSFHGLPSIEELTSYWVGDSFWVYTGIETDRGGGISAKKIYPNKIFDNDGSTGFLSDVLGYIKGFFVRSYYTILWFCKFIISMFDIVTLFLPWNGLLEVKA